MNKNSNLKAFTIVELMVSVFITMVVVASFYKIYDLSAKAERSSAIRVSVNLLGEQMLDTIADSVRFIGLNSNVDDFDYKTTGNFTIIKEAGTSRFQFLSPYGSPITKIKKAENEYPNCKFTIYNSAALNGDTTSFYLHTQDGIYETKRKTSGYKIEYQDYEASFTTDGFESAAHEWGDADSGDTDSGDTDSGDTGTSTATLCKDVFPAGTLISGTDRRFTLKYDDKEFVLYTQNRLDSDSGAKTYMVNFQRSEGGQTYDMPLFVIQYLIETKQTGSDGTTFVRTWNDSVVGENRKNIIAVRFGFVLTSTKDRNKVGGSYTGGEKNVYCIFGTGNSNDCYPSSGSSWDPNKTAYVFRREVYLSNHRLLKDAL